MKKAFTKKDFIVICVLLSAALILFVLGKVSSVGNKAVVRINGKVTEQISLKGDYYEKAFNGVVVCRENGFICIKSSDCPDQICVNNGKLNKKGQCSVCVPNGVSVEITGNGKKSVDAVTG